MKLKMGLILAVAGLSGSAYAQTNAGAPPPPAGDMQHNMADTMAADEHSLTDAQIVAIVKTTNDGEIAAAHVEKKHGKNESAKSFAEGMIDQHSQNNKDFDKLAKKLQMHPEKTAMSDKIHKDAESVSEHFEKMKGADLDRAYIDKQVEMHQHVLDKLDTVLIPQAKSDELKTLLQNTRATVAQHLAHAQEIQKSLGAMAPSANH